MLCAVLAASHGVEVTVGVELNSHRIIVIKPRNITRAKRYLLTPGNYSVGRLKGLARTAPLVGIRNMLIACDLACMTALYSVKTA